MVDAAVVKHLMGYHWGGCWTAQALGVLHRGGAWQFVFMVSELPDSQPPFPALGCAAGSALPRARSPGALAFPVPRRVERRGQKLGGHPHGAKTVGDGTGVSPQSQSHQPSCFEKLQPSCSTR